MELDCKLEEEMRWEERVKLAFFKFYHLLVKNNICKRILYLPLLLIEFIQLLAYLLFLELHKTGDTQDKYLHTFLPYFSIEVVLTSEAYYFISLMTIMGFLFIFFVFLSLLIFVITSVGSSRGEKTKESVLVVCCMNFLSIFNTIIITILFFPICRILLSVFICEHQKEDDLLHAADHEEDDVFEVGELGCRTETHIIICIIAGILFALFFLYTFLSIYFMVDEQPDSKLPWANAPRRTEILKMLKKIIFILLFFLQINASDEMINNLFLGFIVVLNFINLLSIREIFTHLFMNDNVIYIGIMLFESTYTWTSFLIFVKMYTGLSVTADTFLLICIPVSLIPALMIREKRRNSIIYLKCIEESNSARNIEDYVKLLSRLFEGQRKCDNFIELQSILINHIRICEYINCPCQKIAPDIQFRVDSEMNDHPSLDIHTRREKIQNVKSIEYQISKYSVNNIKFFLLLKSWIEKGIEIFGNKARLYIWIAYINFIYLENKFIALYDLMNALEYKPKIFEQFLIYKLEKRIEDELTIESEKHSSIGGMDTSIVGSLTLFQLKTETLLNLMVIALELYIAFWKELQEETPNFRYINNLVYKMSSVTYRIRKLYENLRSLNSRNIYSKMIYAMFIRKLEKDDYEALEIHQQVMRDINSQKFNNVSYWERKYGSNSEAGMILISGNKRNMGEILGANNETERLFGYSKSELLEGRVDKLMPAIIGNKHNEFIKNYFYKLQAKQTLNAENYILSMNHNGALIPSTLVTRQLPNLHKGIQFMGFVLHQANISHLRLNEDNIFSNEVPLILTDSHWMMHGFNDSCARLLGVALEKLNIRRYLKEQKFKLTSLIPELQNPDNLGILLSEDGMDIILDIDTIRAKIEGEIDSFYDEIIADKIVPDDSGTESPELTKWEGQIQVNLKICELSYGRKEAVEEGSNSDYVLKLRALTLKYAIYNKSGTICFKDKQPEERKGLEFLDSIGEEGGESSIATSCVTSMIYQGRFIKNLKGKIHQMKQSSALKVINNLGVLLFILLIALSIANLFMKRSDIAFYYDSVQLIEKAYSMNDLLISIPIIVRTLMNIFYSIENNTSILIDNRSQFFLQELNNITELLQERCQDMIGKGEIYSDEHHELLTEKNIKIIELLSDNKTARTDTIRTFEIASTIYIAKITEISGKPDTFYSKGAVNADKRTVEHLLRTVYEVTENGKGDLKELSERSQKMFLDETIHISKYRQNRITIITICEAVFVLFALLLFVPYIIRLQNNILSIFLKVATIPHKDIKYLITVSNQFTQDLQAPANKLKLLFDLENFMLNQEEDQDEINKVMKTENNIQNILNLQKLEEEKKEGEIVDEDIREEETERLLDNNSKPKTKESAKEKRRVKIKENLFRAAIKSKRRQYILRMFAIFLFFGLYFSIDLVDVISYGNKARDILDIMEKVLYRRSTLLNSLFYLNENLILNRTHTRSIKGDLLKYYLDESFNKEKQMLEIRSELLNHFSSWETYLNNIDGNDSCSHFPLRNIPNKLSKCENIYGGLLKHGFGNSIMNILLHIHHSMLQFMKTERTTEFLLRERTDPKSLQAREIFFYYYELTYQSITDKFCNLTEDFTNFMKKNDNIKFGIFVCLLGIIFVIVWLNLLNNLNLDIMRARGLLNILPTAYLSKQKKFLNTISKNGLFTQIQDAINQ